jgi:hypothetical protein
MVTECHSRAIETAFQPLMLLLIVSCSNDQMMDIIVDFRKENMSSDICCRVHQTGDSNQDSSLRKSARLVLGFSQGWTLAYEGNVIVPRRRAGEHPVYSIRRLDQAALKK